MGRMGGMGGMGGMGRLGGMGGLGGDRPDLEVCYDNYVIYKPPCLT